MYREKLSRDELVSLKVLKCMKLLGSYPVNLMTLIDKLSDITEGRIAVHNYSDYARFTGRTICGVQKQLNSRDAGTIYVEPTDSYIIFYNNMSYPSRINFTIAHELGHIMLGHHINNPSKFMEREADIFAKNLLANPKVIRACEITDCDKVSKVFRISNTAASISLSDAYKLDESKYNAYDKILLNIMAKFIHTRVCSSCSTVFAQVEKLCPHCHSTDVSWYCGPRRISYENIG